MGCARTKVMACRVAPQERKVLGGKIVVAHCVAKVIVDLTGIDGTALAGLGVQ
jgi:hypothetical protein